MLIQCPECQSSISDKAISCPLCGYPIQLLSQPEKRQNESSAKPHRPKKKHKKLPNGFGSIKRLSGKRRNPYAAYPPVTEFKMNGSPVAVPAIGYFEDWYTAFDALREYNHNPYDIKAQELTFADVYQLFFSAKYEHNKKELSKQSKNSTQSAYKNCSKLHNRKFVELKKSDLQTVVDQCPLKHSSLELIVSLFHGMYRYAIENDMVDKDYSQFVTINIADDDEKGEPFTPEQIDILWNNKDVPGVDTILIMIYSGFRIIEYKNMVYNLEEGYLQGGVKTPAGIERTVPIHPAIFPMIRKYGGCFYRGNPDKYRSEVFYPALSILGIGSTPSGKKHTPHDCRHTFSWLCDKYGVDNFSKHLLMGHSFGNDVERSVYGHRTLEELRAEIKKIKIE